jgi:CxxH/CxxC protein (TIGR04129 family)
MYAVCNEHLELAIDRFVDDYEDAPDVVDLEEVRFPNWEPPEHCHDCARKPKFLVV